LIVKRGRTKKLVLEPVPAFAAALVADARVHQALPGGEQRNDFESLCGGGCAALLQFDLGDVAGGDDGGAGVEGGVAGACKRVNTTGLGECAAAASGPWVGLRWGVADAGPGLLLALFV
jgi:hypothetical protein